MALLRNPEFKRLLGACLAATGALTGAGFLWKWEFGLFALAVSAAVSLGLLIFYALHLKRIAGLTRDIQRVLRSGQPLLPSRSREGEYAIFENELYKLSAALHVQLEQANADKKLLSDALADLSHQIKTPLTAMSIECQLLKEETVDAQERRRLARHLDAQLQRVETLVRMLLKMSRIDAEVVSFRKESWRVEELADQALSPLLIPLELREIRVERQGKAEDRCQCDGGWTVEALGNILKNAMEHTPPGGTITLSHQETPLLTRLMIADDGPAIDEADLPHIFERFYRGKNASEDSAGIGLAFARQVITRQNGALTAENTPRGPRFTVTFYKRTV